MRTLLDRLRFWTGWSARGSHNVAKPAPPASGARPVAQRSPTPTVLKTDFCIVGFPKCGTTAIARFLESSPYCHLAKLDDQYESPFYGRIEVDPSALHVAGKLNGHKYTAYAYSFHAFRKMLTRNRRTLFIFCVRDARAALLSWCNMHRQIALRGSPAGHFACSSDENRDFYANCSPSEHYERFSRRRLAYAERIEAVRRRFPKARILVVRQEDLARDPRAVMTRIHAAMGVSVGPDYLAEHAEPHQSFGAKAGSSAEIPDDIAAELKAYDDRLEALIASLPPEERIDAR